MVVLLPVVAASVVVLVVVVVGVVLMVVAVSVTGLVAGLVVDGVLGPLDGAVGAELVILPVDITPAVGDVGGAPSVVVLPESFA